MKKYWLTTTLLSKRTVKTNSRIYSIEKKNNTYLYGYYFFLPTIGVMLTKYWFFFLLLTIFKTLISSILYQKIALTFKKSKNRNHVWKRRI